MDLAIIEGQVQIAVTIHIPECWAKAILVADPGGRGLQLAILIQVEPVAKRQVQIAISVHVTPCQRPTALGKPKRGYGVQRNRAV
jgi:hypothetical protein